MARPMRGQVVLKQLKGVLTSGQTPSLVSHPSVSPLLSFSTPSIQSVACQHLHVASPQSCYRFLTVPSYPILLSSPLPSTPPFLRSAQLSTSPMTLKIRSKVDGEDLMKSKKKQYVAPFITLIDTEDKISKMGLDQAERLARRRDLKLVKVEDPTVIKGSKDVYRLMTGKQYYEQVKSKKAEKKLTSSTKDEKTLAIGGNITQHDLAFKLDSITKWLSKGHQVKVTIASKKSTVENMEKVFSTIEDEITKHKGRILQRHEKMNDIRFYIAPSREKNITSKETTQEDDHASADESRSDQTK